MKRRSITLIEFIISITLAGVLVAALIPQFVMLTSLKMAVEDRVFVMREALIAIDRISGILRFAKPSSVWLILEGSGTPLGWKEVSATIEGGHIAMAPTDTGYRQIWISTPTPDDPTRAMFFYFWQRGSLIGLELIANNVSFYDNDNGDIWTGTRLWNPATKLLTLRLTVTKNKAHAHVERVIKVLGSG
jgi:hypothetical protein